MSSLPRSGRSPGGGNGNPPQYSCLENPIDREAWQATGHGITESDTAERLITLHGRAAHLLCLFCLTENKICHLDTPSV